MSGLPSGRQKIKSSTFLGTLFGRCVISETKEPHVYREPKTAAELGIVCRVESAGAICGQPVLWFDYEIGEKDYMRVSVCDAQKVSNRAERLAMKETNLVAAAAL
jgi:hypothetical protein